MFQTTCQAVVTCTNGTVIFQADRISPDAFGATQLGLAQLVRKIADVKITSNKGKCVVTILLTTSALDHRISESMAKDQKLMDDAADTTAARNDHLLLGTPLPVATIVGGSPIPNKEGVQPDGF